MSSDAAAEAAGEDDPFMLLLRQRAIQQRQELGIPCSSDAEASTSWPSLLPGAPSPEDFRNIIDRHVPVLIERCLDERREVKRWRDSQHLIDRMGSDRKVAVALTPDGRADDLIRHPETGQVVFALPHEEKMSFTRLFEQLSAQSSQASQKPPRIAYLQSQNSNLSVQEYGDLSPLLSDLSIQHGDQKYSDLLWATEAIGYPPEATNIWIGTSASRTSMHRDHYENLFTVVRGYKEFTVFPPWEGCFLCDDTEFEVYRYTEMPNQREALTLQKDPDTPKTRWIPIDPTEPKDSQRNRPFTHRDLNLPSPQTVLRPHSPETKYGYALPPLKIRVEEGQTLYLPSGWYHHVSQQEDSQVTVIDGEERQLGICLCLNWWYEITDDMALHLAEMDLVAGSEGDE